MGELLLRAAQQQHLVDAWTEIRTRARLRDQLGAEHLQFERGVASRLSAMSEQLLAGTWRPSPVRPTSIPKTSGGKRHLGISVLEDRVVEVAVLRIVDVLIDRELLPWSFAYRRGLGVHDALRCLIEARDDGARWVARGDVSRCFDEIPRAQLLDRLAQVVDDEELVEVIRLLIYRPVAGEDGSSRLGLHQGSALSPVLANLHLDRFDRRLLQHGHRVIRYGDDFAVAETSRQRAEVALRAAHSAAAAVGLRMSAAKSAVYSFAEGVPFLGEVTTDGTGVKRRASARPTDKTIYITDTEGLLRSKGARLRLEKGDQVVFTKSFERIRQIVIFGRVGMTTPFMHQVLIRGIDVVLLSSHGRYIGRMVSSTAANSAVRQAQYRAQRGALCLDLARRVVSGKIANLRAGLMRARRRTPERSLSGRIERLERHRASVSDMSTNLQLMGVEGAASREYFAGLAGLLDETWGFTARRRRPPPDPFNSLLSLGYTLLVQEAIAGLESAGLDPYLGYLHEPRVGRPSLALDVVEEFRPVLVDSVALRALNTRMLRPEHFDTQEEPQRRCLLTGEGRRLYLAAYERRLLTLFTHPHAARRVSYRVGIQLQSRALANELLGKSGTRYEPLVWK